MNYRFLAQIIGEDFSTPPPSSIMVRGRNPKIQEAIMKLWNIAPLFAVFMSGVSVVEIPEEKAEEIWGDHTPTAAAGYNPQTRNPVIYYATSFIENATSDELVGVLCHECLHLWKHHFIRVQDRDRDLWNIVTDKVINYSLFKSSTSPLNRNGFKARLPDEEKAGYFYSGVPFKMGGKTINPLENETGMSSEEIYDKIYDEVSSEMKKIEKLGKGKPGGLGGGKGKPGSGGGGEGKPGSGSETGNSDSKTEAGKEWAKGHIYTDDPTIASEVSNVIDDMVKSAIQTVKSRGLMSSNDEEFLRKFLEYSNTSWFSDLRYYLGKTINLIQKKYSPFGPPSETRFIRNTISKKTGYDTILDEPIREKIKRYSINVLIDTSGSMSSYDLVKALSIMLTLTNKYEVFLFEVDAGVKLMKRLTTKIVKDIKNRGIKMIGRGGTDFQPYFDLLEEKKWLNKCITVIITDGYFGSFDDKGNKVFIVTTTGEVDSKSKNTLKVIDASKGGFSDHKK